MVTIQSALYLFLIFSIAMLAALLFKPNEVSSLFRHKRVSIPLSAILTLVILLFLRSTYAEYSKNYKHLPDHIKEETIEYITWQKDRHKLERDTYLSLSCLLSHL